jgi:acyl-coenzyme A thioesterase PaaI-like protein
MILVRRPNLFSFPPQSLPTFQERSNFSMTTWDSDNFLTILQDGETDAKHLTFFKATPWARIWLEDARYKTISSTSRMPKADGEDNYIAITLGTPSTIPHWLLLANKTLSSPEEMSQQSAPGPEHPDIILLANMEKALAGFRNITHGGVLMSLLDEVIGTCVEIHRRTKTSGREPLFTANLNVNFRRPVITPGPAVVKAWLEERDERKWRLRAMVVDAEGLVCAEASGLWIAARARTRRL